MTDEAPSSEAQAAALQQLAQRNALILQTVAEGIVGVDRHGVITFANRWAAQAIGKTVDEMVGAQAHEVARHTREDGSACDGSACPLMKVFDTGLAVHHTETSFIGPDGQPFPVEYSIVPATAAGCAEGLDGAVLSFRNIAQRKRLQADLLEAAVAAETASRAKSQFLSNMSHELRTPLNAIIGYSDMLIDEATGEQAALKADLDKIRQSGHDLLALVDKLLEIARIEAGRMQVVVANCEISTLVYEVQTHFGTLPDPYANRLSVSGAQQAGSLRTDVDKVRTILMSLLSNANKFSRNGEVTLEVRRPADAPGQVQFLIGDKGAGIAPDVLATLFDPFVQGDGSTTRRHGGTGLGLALASRLARLLKGSITVQTVLGQGSTFIVTLPDAEAATDAGGHANADPLADADEHSAAPPDARATGGAGADAGADGKANANADADADAHADVDADADAGAGPAVGRHAREP